MAHEAMHVQAGGRAVAAGLVVQAVSSKLDKSSVEPHVPLDLRANEEEEDAVQSYYGEGLAPTHPTHTHSAAMSHGPEHAPLKDREELARLAFRAWFRIKPGNKEIKDRWWALYYKKLHPKYHMRDNHLGRKINMWIEEEVERLRDPTRIPLVGSRKPPALLADVGLDGTGAGMKKKKPNSTKEGTQPAYINVELQQPPKSITGELADWLKPLAMCLRDETTTLDWSKEVLEEDVAWFRDNRESIMEQIPSLVSRGRRASSPSPGMHNSALKKHKPDMDSSEGITVECDQEWLRCDVLKGADEIIVRVDLAGCAPAHDFELQTGSEPPNANTGAPGGHKLIVKGERKPDPAVSAGAAAYVHQSRPLGRFQLVVSLPVTAEISKTEQTFACGVLTVKVPLATAWRTLDVLAVGQ